MARSYAEWRSEMLRWAEEMLAEARRTYSEALSKASKRCGGAEGCNPAFYVNPRLMAAVNHAIDSLNELIAYLRRHPRRFYRCCGGYADAVAEAKAMAERAMYWLDVARSVPALWSPPQSANPTREIRKSMERMRSKYILNLVMKARDALRRNTWLPQYERALIERALELAEAAAKKGGNEAARVIRPLHTITNTLLANTTRPENPGWVIYTLNVALRRLGLPAPLPGPAQHAQARATPAPAHSPSGDVAVRIARLRDEIRRILDHAITTGDTSKLALIPQLVEEIKKLLAWQRQIAAGMQRRYVMPA